ncbi:uncharacterized protein BDR25DRAFT_355107 [Lindgomyces ingoldianus]|uniref:Uncharacterized protein n=1 Tax=Lindgomyces ingoldianus TaxID=673940 RepID=A0ACB6QUU6_9PLEO|nr:uncharacterized protein BDR25DRAFT_355107 [Lindgomyces ingoldianus]KAF2470621.1 hypothetical protein BDR25DRAFT_355107 [Lindgomyces ingoldianus]
MAEHRGPIHYTAASMPPQTPIKLKFETRGVDLNLQSSISKIGHADRPLSKAGAGMSSLGLTVLDKSFCRVDGVEEFELSKAHRDCLNVEIPRLREDQGRNIGREYPKTVEGSINRILNCGCLIRIGAHNKRALIFVIVQSSCRVCGKKERYSGETFKQCSPVAKQVFDARRWREFTNQRRTKRSVCVRHRSLFDYLEACWRCCKEGRVKGCEMKPSIGPLHCCTRKRPSSHCHEELHCGGSKDALASKAKNVIFHRQRLCGHHQGTEGALSWWHNKLKILAHNAATTLTMQPFKIRSTRRQLRSIADFCKLASMRHRFEGSECKAATLFLSDSTTCVFHYGLSYVPTSWFARPEPPTKTRYEPDPLGDKFETRCSQQKKYSATEQVSRTGPHRDNIEQKLCFEKDKVPICVKEPTIAMAEEYYFTSFAQKG